MTPAPYILFVVPGPICNGVIQLAKVYGPQVIELVNVATMPNRPPWLTGVPTLISRTQQFAPLTGEVIEPWLRQGLNQQTSTYKAVSPAQQPQNCVDGVCELPTGEEPTAQGSKAGFAYVGTTTDTEYANLKEQLYSRKKKIGDQDVEAYMRMRETPAPAKPTYVGVSDVDGTRVTM